MKWWGPSVGCIGAAFLFGVPSEAQVIPFQERTFNEQILRPSGQPVVPLYEGRDISPLEVGSGIGSRFSGSGCVSAPVIRVMPPRRS